jgi:hypothetical protein
MRLLKSVTSISAVTLMALLYVHQHVEMVKVSYSIERKEKKIVEMLDRRGKLGYTIKNLEAPSRLEDILLSGKVDIVYPKRAQVYKAAQISYNTTDRQPERLGQEERFNISGIVDFLGPRAEAHARER